MPLQPPSAPAAAPAIVSSSEAWTTMGPTFPARPLKAYRETEEGGGGGVSEVDLVLSLSQLKLQVQVSPPRPRPRLLLLSRRGHRVGRAGRVHPRGRAEVARGLRMRMRRGRRGGGIGVDKGEGAWLLLGKLWRGRL